MSPTMTPEQIKELLLQTFCKRADAQAAVDAADEQIIGLRNVLAGIPVGVTLANTSQAAEKAAQVPLTK